MARDECFDALEHALDDRRRRLTRDLAQQHVQPVLAELVALGVLRVGDAVREEQQRITRTEARAGFAARQARRQQAQRRAGGAERKDGAIAAEDHVVEMPRAGKLQLPG